MTELEGQMALFDYTDIQPDESCDGCCVCDPDGCSPDCECRTEDQTHGDSP